MAGSLLPPSAAHPLGTNETGQDLLSQLIFGTRGTLLVAPAAALLTVALGMSIGVGAALTGGTADALVSRSVDAALALPKLPLLVLLAATAGPSPATIVFSIALLSWPMSARIVRAQTLSLRRREFLAAARGFGAGPLYLARRHLFPALAPILLAGFVSVAAHAVLLEAGLAFLGLTDPNRPSWGLMMNEALTYRGLFFGESWIWWLLPPGTAITLAILGFTFLGVGLEPRLNPRVQEHLT